MTVYWTVWPADGALGLHEITMGLMVSRNFVDVKGLALVAPKAASARRIGSLTMVARSCKLWAKHVSGFHI